MCPSLNQSLWLGSQPHWNRNGGVCPTHHGDSSGDLWSMEGKADSIPKRDVGEVVETMGVGVWGMGKGVECLSGSSSHV